MQTEKSTHGGKRAGSGRKSKEPTATLSFRVSKVKADKAKALHGDALKEKFNDWLDSVI